MNKFYTAFLILFLSVFCSSRLHAQDIQVIFHETNLYDTLGSEIIFDFEIVNISQQNQVVFLVRSNNQLPPSWGSALCFGINCYPPGLDSIAAPEELEPGDTLPGSLHVYPLENHGTAYLQIQIATIRNPNDRIIQDFVATTILNDINDPNVLAGYSLLQNYPNPFNPSTDITFSLKHSSFVKLKVFNLIGEEVALLVNDHLNRGMHNIKFNAAGMNSGVYLYRLDAIAIDGSRFSSVKKMILAK